MDQNNKPVPGRTIIATFKIAKENVKKDVQIINDRSPGSVNIRTGIESIYIYKLCNNKEEQVWHIDGGKKDWKIPKQHEFNESGWYKIYYYFKEDVTDMSFMFAGCPSLTTLDFSNFNTQNVKDMSYMFRGCSSLTSLNLSNFNTDSVTDMSYMFCGCSSLKTLDLSNFNTEKVGVKKDLFDGCSSLEKVTTNDEHIESLFKGKKVIVLHPNKVEENIEIVGNSDNLKGDSQTKSESKCWCCPCCKNR
ncbi:MAG: BspA family leucine-rich repeat surface protein [Cytophagales bacterium]|nr:BspA family leucine-rich repeat surface protein [Cytophagales bacterium]